MDSEEDQRRQGNAGLHAQLSARPGLHLSIIAFDPGQALYQQVRWALMLLDPREEPLQNRLIFFNSRTRSVHSLEIDTGEHIIVDTEICYIYNLDFNRKNDFLHAIEDFGTGNSVREDEYVYSLVGALVRARVIDANDETFRIQWERARELRRIVQNNDFGGPQDDFGGNRGGNRGPLGGFGGNRRGVGRGRGGHGGPHSGFGGPLGGLTGPFGGLDDILEAFGGIPGGFGGLLGGLGGNRGGIAGAFSGITGGVGGNHGDFDDLSGGFTHVFFDGRDYHYHRFHNHEFDEDLEFNN